MIETKALQQFYEEDFIPVDMSIIGVSIDRKQPDGNGLFSFSGRIIVSLDGFPNSTFSLEWLAYHKDSDKQFLKTSPQWHILYGDWHMNFNGRYGEIKVNGFEIIEEDTGKPLSEEAQQHLIHSVFHENYPWKKRIQEALDNHINN